MPRRTLTDAEKKAISRRMKKLWKHRTGEAPPIEVTPTNGLIVESRIVVTVHEQEIILNIGEARQLKDALSAALPAPTEPDR